MSEPGGPGPSPDPNPPPTPLASDHNPWIRLLGPQLVVHDGHGYSSWDRQAPTSTVVHGRTVVGIYFSADWCPPCVQFTPLLTALHAARRAHCTLTSRTIPSFEVVLVSRCKDVIASERYFAGMPWTAMPHEASVGQRGLTLMARFGITSIPALILLDGEGTEICRDGHERLRADPAGTDFPWSRPRVRAAQVGFDLTTHTCPDVARMRSPASPPAFGQVPTFRPSSPVGGGPRPSSPATSAHPPRSDTRRGQPRPAVPTGSGAPRVSRKRDVPPVVVPPRKPPPKPNLDIRAKANDAPEGKPTSLMQPQPLADAHPFTPTLKSWRSGINVDCGPEWTWDVVEAAVARGPHPTAITPDSIALFKEDIAYQVKAGFSKVMLWEDVKRLRPTNLKISPVAVVPQTGRRGRIILDLSFPVYQEVDGVATATQASVNSTTVVTAPSTPVKEIGKVLPRMLQYMRDTPPGLHILFSKLDISDGFWRLIVQEADSYNFAYVLPQEASKPCRLVVPSAVQMGWVESPSLFCTVTESARDITQHLIDDGIELPPDEVEDLISIQDVPPRGRTRNPTKLLQVYVDDFCYAATQSDDGLHIPTIRRASIHGIHSFFPPTCITEHKGGKPPISKSKLEKGDGNYESTKDMIGFRFDGIKRTVHLPPEKAAAYIKEAHRILRRKTVPIKALQALVGKLRHASVILPAAKGFFTPLNDAMKGSPKIIGLGQNSEIRAALYDLISLIRLLGSRPTHVRELVPDMPHYVGYHDAAAEGAGGVWFSLVDTMQPVVWREAFPSDISSEVISDDNPSGRLTNSDLELAAEVLAIGVALSSAPTVKHAPLGTLCDNTPTVSWIDRMASKSKSPTAGRLLRGLAFMLYTCHAGRLTTVHVPGVDNVMADIASRPSKAQTMFCAPSPLTDAAFRSSFDTVFPLPDNQTWSLVNVPEWMKSNVFETLRGKRLELRQWTGPNANATGKRGKRIARPSTHTGGQPLKRTSSSRLLLPCGKDSTVSEIQSRFSQSSGLSGTSPKGLFWTDIKTPDDPPPLSKRLTSPLPDS